MALSSQGYRSKYGKNGDIQLGWGHEPSTLVYVRHVEDLQKDLFVLSDLSNCGLADSEKSKSVASVSFSIDNTKLMMVGNDGVVIVRNISLSDIEVEDFGYCSDKPIPTKGIAGTIDYLTRLKDCSGKPVSFERCGSEMTTRYKMPIDIYEVFGTFQSRTKLYFVAYQNSTSEISPKGFRLSFADKALATDKDMLKKYAKIHPLVCGNLLFKNIRTVEEQKQIWGSSKVWPVTSHIGKDIIRWDDGTPKMVLSDGINRHSVPISKSLCNRIDKKQPLPTVIIADVHDLATNTTESCMFEEDLTEFLFE